MSWDIFVQDFPPDAASVSAIPDDFRPCTLGSRNELISEFLEVVPSADFSDKSWGKIEGDGWSIEINICEEMDCNGFALHVRGRNEAAGAVEAILNHLGTRAIDSQTGEFFVAGPEARRSFEKWRNHRDFVTGQ